MHAEVIRKHNNKIIIFFCNNTPQKHQNRTPTCCPFLGGELNRLLILSGESSGWRDAIPGVAQNTLVLLPNTGCCYAFEKVIK